MATQYSLTCINDSQLPGSFVVFQRPPPMTVPANVVTLAWLARPTHPGTQVTFQWTLDYNFVWSEIGILQPGITFSGSQVIPANPEDLNFTQLTEDGIGATYFTEPRATGTMGSLTIEQLSNVVPNRTACGIGMSGMGTFVVQAAPNMTTVFTPHPNYWVAFGNFESGQVMDIEEVFGAVEVTFPEATTSRTVTLQPSNILTVGDQDEAGADALSVSFTLTVRNTSSVPGPQYFNVYPPPLTVMPPQTQIVVPLVSEATKWNGLAVTMKWPAPPALWLVALVPGQSPAEAPRTPVTPGGSAMIHWIDGAFAVTVAYGIGPAIRLIYGAGIPPGSHVGLMNGPGTTLLPISGSELTITPNLTPTYMVQFGTPWQSDPSAFRNLSTLTPVTFSRQTATIEVGADNKVVQQA